MDNSQKTAIVTGLTGQMGSYMTEALLNKGLRVIGTLRRLSVNNHKNIVHLKDHPNLILAPMDLCDPHSINALVEKYKPDYFINCAANSFVGSSWDFPEQHIEYNLLGVQRQLEAIKRFSPHTRYINFGSSEEFGDVAYSPQDEKHPGRARSPYGASKIGARQIVKVYRESFGLYAIQCWCFNYESERRGEEFVTRKITLGVARIAKAIKEGNFDFEPIELGNIDAKRDWSHAEDFVDGIWRMLNQEVYRKGNSTEGFSFSEMLAVLEGKPLIPTSIQEYVLSSNETHTVREFIEKAFAAAGIRGIWWDSGFNGDPKDEQFLFSRDGVLATKRAIPLVKINPAFYRPADVELLLGNSNKARTELGWAPRVTFDELVKRMVVNDLKDQGIEI